MNIPYKAIVIALWSASLLLMSFGLGQACGGQNCPELPHSCEVPKDWIE
jgi:hypothetical protein